MKSVKFYILILIFSLFLSACSSSTNASAIGIDRKQLFLVGENEMNQQASLAYTKTITDASHKNQLNVNAIQTKRVRDIANRLIKQVSYFRSDASKWNWQTNVIQDKQINAWCMPGGKIVVYSGIINTLRLTDAELAAVIGHEMGHALREHSREQASTSTITSIGSAIAGMATNIAGYGDIGSTVGNAVGQYGIGLPFSRKHEAEADIIGIELMARAGYNPNSAINVWKKMQRLNQGSTPEFLSTHPSNESRIAELSKMIGRVMPLYEQSSKK